MKKLIRNIYNLLSISTPYFIIFNYIKNYFPNYRKKKQCSNIDEKIYQNFKSIDLSKKWFTNNLYFLSKNLSNLKVKNLLEIGSYEGRSAIFFITFFNYAKIYCVDTWKGSDEHKKNIFKRVEKNFDLNTFSYLNDKKLIKVKTDSDSFFKKLLFNLHNVFINFIF